MGKDGIGVDVSGGRALMARADGTVVDLTPLVEAGERPAQDPQDPQDPQNAQNPQNAQAPQNARDAEPEAGEKVVRVLERALESMGTTRPAVALGECSSRSLWLSLRFPFSSPKKIASVLALELENAIPSSAGACVWSHWLVPSQDSKGQVLVACMPAAYVSTLYGALKEQEALPDVLSLEVEGLEYAARAVQTGDEAVLLLDVAPDRTCALLRRENRPAAVRCLPFGTGAGPKNRTPQPEDDAETPRVRALAATVARECLLGLEAADAPLPEYVILCGEGASEPGFKEHLEDALSIPVRRMVELPGYLPAQDTEDMGLAAAGAAAWGLSLRAGRRDGMQFWQGSNKPPGRPIGSGGIVWWWAGLTVAICLCWVLWLSWGIFHKYSGLQDIENAISSTFKQALPDVKGDFSTAQKVSILKSRTRELERAVESIEMSSTLETIRVVVDALELDDGIRVEELTMEGDVVRIAGTASGFAQLEKSRSKLLESGLFEMVNIGSSTVEKKTGRVLFELRLTLRDQ